VPNIDEYAELASVLQEKQAFDSEADLSMSLSKLRAAMGDPVGLGIKKVLLALDNAKREGDMIDRFPEEILKKKRALDDEIGI